MPASRNNGKISKKPVKFRHAASALHDLSFASNQTWISAKAQGPLSFVHEDGQSSGPVIPTPTLREHRTNVLAKEPLQKRVKPVRPRTPPPPIAADSPWYGGEGALMGRNAIDREAEHDGSHPRYHSLQLQPLTQGMVPWPDFLSPDECACLLRFHIDVLAPWADAGSPDRPFALVAPYKAMGCSLLMDGILAATARYLISSRDFRDDQGRISYCGFVLSGLSPATAIQFHGACVTKLIDVCAHPDPSNEDLLLPAMTALRFHDELDAGLSEREGNRLLALFSTFLRAHPLQLPLINGHAASHAIQAHAPNTAASDILALNIVESSSQRLTRAAYRVALRQELTWAMLHNQPSMLPLEPWRALDNMDPESLHDHLWTDRHVLQCARVLQFCHGPREGQTQAAWKRLKQYEELWQASAPALFTPLISRKPDTDAGEVFPTVWFLSEVHANGIQWYEIGRLLLLLHDPFWQSNSISDAPGKWRQTLDEVRTGVKYICGIAKSNPGCYPLWAQASMAIIAFGEHFADHREQAAVLEILDHQARRFNWPVKVYEDRLVEAWAATQAV